MKQIKKLLEKVLIGQSVPIEKIIPTVTTFYPTKDVNYNPCCTDCYNSWFKYIHSYKKK